MYVRRVIASTLLVSGLLFANAKAATIDLTTGAPGTHVHWSGYKGSDGSSRQRYFRLGKTVYNSEVKTYRTFLVFNLAGINGRIAAAELLMFNGNADSQDAVETIRLYDVTTPTQQILSPAATPQIFDDLGTGVTYGVNLDFSPAASASTVRAFPLNAACLTDINASLGGDFKIGVSLETINPQRNSHEFIEYAGQYGESTLRLTVIPEPSVVQLMIPAFCVFSQIRRRFH